MEKSSARALCACEFEDRRRRPYPSTDAATRTCALGPALTEHVTLPVASVHLPDAVKPDHMIVLMQRPAHLQLASQLIGIKTLHVASVHAPDAAESNHAMSPL